MSYLGSLVAVLPSAVWALINSKPSLFLAFKELLVFSLKFLSHFRKARGTL